MDEVATIFNEHTNNQSLLGLDNLEFKDEIFRPESLEFDTWSRGPYAGLAMDVLTEKLCAKGVDSTTHKQWKFKSRCSRPLGLRVDRESGYLNIADSYYGFLVVGPEEGLPSHLATHVDTWTGSLFITMALSVSLILAKNTDRVIIKYFLEGSERAPIDSMQNFQDSQTTYGLIVEKHILPIAHSNEEISQVGRSEDVFYGTTSLSDKGDILDVLEDKKGVVMKLVSEVKEANGKL
ncbi:STRICTOSIDINE SYNTHASE-LIKE 13 [Olea europaea subsp. europaea]|uniref:STRICTOSIDINE SYNTHASE-LIKE 13 n=1 Tax=Olea europaea subsp. europaea TaxID=158383 RepID=A0A8S0UWT8_OLEEU|nr:STRICTOSIDINE SYNTHASE-LIKE 13 [Olea europaea subsp. europaea]